ncbi:MAG: GTP pyrophosphokinase family protein [Lachnospiraceae bacterium]|nr:GTP pyrophosphokinase family protein [Lachnospiraceae bacterium]
MFEQNNEMMDKFIRENFLNDNFIDFMTENMSPMEELMAYYRCAIMEVETKFRVLNEEFSLQYDRNPIESIKSRIKSTNSLMKKIGRKNIPLTLESVEENIWDIAGVRVICSFPDDIYFLADCLLQQDDIKLIERKDYIKNPKPSGYRSLHLIVEVPIFLQNEKRNMKVEVQLRTIAMDFWAAVEHKLRYKKDIPRELQEELQTELIECAKQSAELDLRMQKVKNQIAAASKEAANDYDIFSILPFLKNIKNVSIPKLQINDEIIEIGLDDLQDINKE